ncbi:MAG: HEAT repeat domain-containing protein, partial [Candidatus Polarisedimenticolia bacterium]
LLGRALPGAGGAPSDDPGGAASGEAPVASVSDLDADPETGRVRLRYDTVRRATLEGSAADPGMRRLLVRTVREHPNDGLRLRAMEALRGRIGDAEVRTAFQEAALRDPNAGARLRAIDALAGSAAGDPGVRGAILQALLGDDNPGVRVRALDVLETARGPETRTVFERLAREDPNDYVRFRSAAFAGGAIPAAETR